MADASKLSDGVQLINIADQGARDRLDEDEEKLEKKTNDPIDGGINVFGSVHETVRSAVESFDGISVMTVDDIDALFD